MRSRAASWPDGLDATRAGFVAPPQQQQPERHWRVNRRIVASMLVVWFVVTFVTMFFARELSAAVAGWPVGFWIAAQGSLLVYLLLVCGYARLMRRLDQACGVDEAA